MADAFREFGLEEMVLEGISSMAFKEPTPIQKLAIPKIMAGKDLIACAQTGTGKTGAFVIPVLNHLFKNKGNGVRCLVIVPTRELAKQIDQQVEALSYFTNVVSLPIYGGSISSDWEMQKKAITRGADILIATPGRILTHLNMGYVDLSHLEYFILDEADKMLDMGFQEDIVKVINKLPEKRQNLMFSATMPPKIRVLAKKMLQNPEEISIMPSRVAKGVEQQVYFVHDRDKETLLKNLLDVSSLERMIIFASSRQKVINLGRMLQKARFETAAIHSDLDQPEREANLRKFKNKEIRALVATDILSRGIDVEGVSHVINFDMPGDPEDYIHRIGRTARAERTGIAISFACESDFHKFRNIEKFVEQDILIQKLPESIKDAPDYNGFKSRGKRNFKSQPFRSKPRNPRRRDN